MSPHRLPDSAIYGLWLAAKIPNRIPYDYDRLCEALELLEGNDLELIADVLLRNFGRAALARHYGVSLRRLNNAVALALDRTKRRVVEQYDIVHDANKLVDTLMSK